jgi:hypothetical protein
MNATSSMANIIRVRTSRNASAAMVEPIVIPSSSVTKFASSFFAAGDRRSGTPHTRMRFPNMRAPISVTLMGAIMLAISVIIIGNNISTDLGMNLVV